MAWHCKNTGGYTTGTPVYNYPASPEGTENVLQMYYLLSSLGWTVNAICGFVTCVAFESGYNPWRWEANHIFTEAGVDLDNYPGSYGYGLVQWTPASYMNAAYYSLRGERPNKYINNPASTGIAGYGPNYSDVPGSQFDGYAQLVYLDSDGWRQQYFTDGTYYGNIAPTFSQFKASTAAASDLCETWVCDFERPANPGTNRVYRQALATELYNWLSNEPVLPPDTPGPRFPVWLLLKWRQDNIKGGR